ncbi:MAG TPA: hypothetical protein VFN26_05605 [Candidatus Acidoferrum sp.]|nr:hypothetical protein [Candidatus Acidoferrum sp.]
MLPSVGENPIGMVSEVIRAFLFFAPGQWVSFRVPRNSGATSGDLLGGYPQAASVPYAAFGQTC